MGGTIYSVYILQSQISGKYYIGSSENPQRRLVFHNSVEKGFTARYRPWEIVYTKEFSDKHLAQVAERKIKSWKSRIMIDKLLNGLVEL
jgi:putative endonuclease